MTGKEALENAIEILDMNRQNMGRDEELHMASLLIIEFVEQALDENHVSDEVRGLHQMRRDMQSKIESLEGKLAEKPCVDLVSAAQDVVDRWHTPKWKDAAHTGRYISSLQQALAQQQPDGWKLIESAPKDGTEFLCLMEEAVYKARYFNGNFSIFHHSPYQPSKHALIPAEYEGKEVTAKYELERGRYICDPHYSSYVAGWTFKPTHWQAFPTAPQEDK